MKKALTVIALMSTLAFTTAASANAERHHMLTPQALLSDRVAEQLALTDEQKVRIQDLVEAHRSQYPQTDRKQAFKQNREAVEALMAEPVFDETAARELLNEATERRLLSMKTQHEISRILTQDQRQQLTQLRQRRLGKASHGRYKHRRDGKRQQH